MPPKGKKAAKSADEEEGGDLGVEEKLVKAQLEIESLQRELEIKNEINARLRQQSYDYKQRVVYLETQMELRAKDRQELTSDMSRQFKIMQGELVSEVNRLENTSFELNTKLTGMQTAHTETKAKFAETVAEKDAQFEEISLKMGYMTSEFENMMNEVMQRVTKKLDVVSTRWKENDMVTLSEQNTRRLDDFQLTRLALGNTRRF